VPNNEGSFADCAPRNCTTAEAATVGLWLYLGQFPGDELAEPYVLNLLRDDTDPFGPTPSLEIDAFGLAQRHPGAH
jgi:hypothetical protein